MKTLFACVLVLLCETDAQLNLLGLEVTDLLNLKPKPKPTKNEVHVACKPSPSLYPNGEHPCSNKLIFEDNFNDKFLNKNKWTVEQYIPIVKGPDYEFVSYQDSDELLFLNGGNLIVNPVALTNETDVRGELDLKNGCTKPDESECTYNQVGVFLIPPVKSARISSKFSFTYGTIEVRAKLPAGDWIYPILELEHRTKSIEGNKIRIAFSRGNDYYGGPAGDIGSRTLFGGAVLGTAEPERSSAIHNTSSYVPFHNDMHVYKLVWEPDQIKVLVDDKLYGVTYLDRHDSRFATFNNELRVSLGVAVGGTSDFPDNHTTNRPKPWTNMDRKQYKDFFDARNEWLATWREDRKQLKIDYVKIWAI